MKKLMISEETARSASPSSATYIAELIRELEALAAREGLGPLRDRLHAAEIEARKAAESPAA